MNENLEKLFTSVAGPQISQELTYPANLLMEAYRDHLDFTINGIKRHRSTVLTGIFIDIVDEMQTNAIAYSSPSGDIVGIYGGIATTIPTFFNWLLHIPQVFDDIGDVSNESFYVKSDPLMFTVQGKMSAIKKGEWPWQIVCPKDSMRLNYASFTTRLAWDFLLLHEIAHIRRCHIPYLESHVRTSRAKGYLLEFDRNLTSQEAELARILEVDADVSAVQNLSTGFISHSLETAWQILFGNQHAVSSEWDWQKACSYYVRALSLIFLLFYIIEGKLDTPVRLRTHPLPGIRLKLLNIYLWDVWHKVLPDSKSFLDIIENITHEIAALTEQGIIPILTDLIDIKLALSSRDITPDDYSIDSLMRFLDDVRARAKDLDELTYARQDRIDSLINS